MLLYEGIIFSVLLQLFPKLEGQQWPSAPPVFPTHIPPRTPLYRCPGPLIDDSISMTPIGPLQNPPNNNPKNFGPYKILFLIDPGMDPQNKAKLEKLTKGVHDELSKALNGPRLNDIRFLPSLKPNDRNACADRVCYGIPIPLQYALPCILRGRPDPNNIPSEPTDEVKEMNKAGYSVVILVAVDGEGWMRNPIRQSCPGGELVLASAGACQFDRWTQRPTHGQMVWCIPPKNRTDDDEMMITTLHETLHVVIPNLVGSGYPFNNCYPPISSQFYPALSSSTAVVICPDGVPMISYGDGKTWKRIDTNWVMPGATPIQLPTYFATWGRLPEVVQDYLQCASVPGAPVNQIEENDQLVPDFGHWNQRYFLDEVLAPNLFSGQVLSNMTLFAIAAYKSWYTVNFQHAHPLTGSRGAGCDFTTKSCHEMFNEWRASPKGDSVAAFGPYCDNTEVTFPTTAMPIPSNLCTRASQRFECIREPGITFDYCPVMAPVTYPYDNWACEKTKTLQDRTYPTYIGAAAGSDTICVTTLITPFVRFNDLSSVCIKHQCRLESSTILLTLRPRFVPDECTMECSAAQSNKVVNFTPSCVAHKPDPTVSLICPDYDQVCVPATTTTTTTSTATTTTATATTTTSAATKRFSLCALAVMLFTSHVLMSISMI